MGSDEDYVEYSLQLILAVLGASASTFISISEPSTYLSLLVLPFLYGHTAYISQDGFNYSSLMSLSALMLIVTGGVSALTAIFYSIGNVLVSMFSSGSGFKEFYGSVSLPLLILGALIGLSVFGYGSLTPGFQDEVAEKAGQQIGNFSAGIVEDMGLVENQKQSQLRLVNNTARTAVALTAQKVLNEVESTPELQNSLATAEDNVTQQIYRRTKAGMGQQDIDISQKMAETMTNYFKRMNLILLVPLITGFFYTLQPILGISTAIFGKLWMLLYG